MYEKAIKLWEGSRNIGNAVIANIIAGRTLAKKQKVELRFYQGE